MAFIEKFLGHRVTLPDDLRYFVTQGLWARLDDRVIVFGFSEPALTLLGGIQDLKFGHPDAKDQLTRRGIFLKFDHAIYKNDTSPFGKGGSRGIFQVDSLRNPP